MRPAVQAPWPAAVLLLAWAPLLVSSHRTTGPGPWDASAPPTWASHALRRVSLEQHPLARCNDGRPAAIYTDADRVAAGAAAAAADASPLSFVVYVEGGSACFDAEGCEERLHRWARPGYDPGGGYNPLMQGLPAEGDGNKVGAAAGGNWPESLNVGGPLLGQPTGDASDASSPFAGGAWRRVHIPYCTSDMHLGRRCGNATGAATDAALGFVDGNPAPTTSGYCGAHVMEAALEELVQHHGMGSAAQVVLWGVSAGGVGAAHHAEAWREALGPAVDLRLALDSAWLAPTPPLEEDESTGANVPAVDYRGGGLAREQANSVRNALEWGVQAPSACAEEARRMLGIDDVADYGAADAQLVAAEVAAWCAPVRRTLPHIQAPTWLLQPAYDMYVFIPAVGLLPERDAADTTLLDNLMLYRWMEEFGALSRASVEATSYDVRTARHTAVVPACLFHGASYHDERWLVRSIPYFESTGMPDWSFMDYELAGVDFPWAMEDPLRALEGLRVHNRSVLELLGAWVQTDAAELLERGSHQPGVTTPQGMRLIADTCTGINCNPTCEAAFRLLPADLPPLDLGPPDSLGKALAVMLLALLLMGLFVSDIFSMALSFVRTKRWASLTGKQTRKTADASSTRNPVASASSEGASPPPPKIRKKGSLLATEVPFPIELCCVSYSVTNWNTGEWLPLLRNVSLRFAGARLTAVMGSSGCGKTTLLELMVGRRLSGRVEGLLLRNHLQASDATDAGLNESCGYVPQFEFEAYPTLTPREALLYEVGVRLPHLGTKATVRRVRHVLRAVKLDGDKADTQIGTVGGGGGLSGGQRRRLSVGKQLLRDPLWIFGDEPTSGLDSYGTLELVQSLRDITTQGRAIALTIHQPRDEVFRFFDDLVLMSKGRVVFAGPVTDAVDYFMGRNGLARAFMPEPVLGNPADVMLDLISMDDDTVDKVVEKNASRQRRTALVVLDGALKKLASDESLIEMAEKQGAQATEPDATTQDVANVALLPLVKRAVAYARSGSTRVAGLDRTTSGLSSLGSEILAEMSGRRILRMISSVKGIFGAASMQVVDRTNAAMIGEEEDWSEEADRLKQSATRRWIKVALTLHGRQFRTDIKRPRENLASIAFVIVVGALFGGLTYYMPGRDAQGYVRKYVGVTFYLTAVALSKVVLMETTYQYATIHKASQRDGGESAVQFMVSLMVAQTTRAWLGIGIAAFTLIGMLDLPMRSAPVLLLSAVLLDAVMAGAIVTIACLANDSTPKSMLSALIALSSAVVSGAVLPWKDLHVAYRWIGLVTPMSYSRYLALGNLFTGETFECADGDSDGTVFATTCGLLDGDIAIGALASKEPPFTWALNNQHMAILILILQAAMWRLFAVLGLYYRQDSRTIEYAPCCENLDSLLDDEGESGEMRRVAEQESKAASRSSEETSGTNDEVRARYRSALTRVKLGMLAGWSTSSSKRREDGPDTGGASDKAGSLNAEDAALERVSTILGGWPTSSSKRRDDGPDAGGASDKAGSPNAEDAADS